MQDQPRDKKIVGRRQFLQTGISGVVAGMATQSLLNVATARSLNAQTDMSPDAALRELLAGNERFAANRLTSVERDLSILKEKTLDKRSRSRQSWPAPTPGFPLNLSSMRPSDTSLSHASRAT